jgi:hypothetical protein
MVAVALAVSVSTCVPETVPAANDAVTPLGNPVAARVTLPVNPFAPVTVIVLVPVLPCTTETLVGNAESVKLGAAFTVTEIVVDPVSAPELPLMVTVTELTGVAAAPAVRVSTCVPLTVPVANDAVTPLGSPLAARVTAPVNPPTSVTVTVLVPVLPCTTGTLVGEAESVKPGAMLTVSLIVPVSVSEPEVPVMVTVTGLVVTVAVLEAVSVITWVPLTVPAAKDAVTPVGNPVADSVTLPLNPLAGPIVMVSVALLPCTTVTLLVVGVSVKLGAGVIQRLTVVLAVRLPEVPLIVTVAAFVVTAALLLAVSVSTCVPETVPAANDAVTPVGNPVAARVTVPLNPLAPVTVTVLVPVPPWATDTLVGKAEIVKLGPAVTETSTEVDAVSVLEVPLMITVAGLVVTVALPLAVSVSTCVPVTVPAANDAVTPLGSPVAARVTVPLNPFAPVTVMVLVPVLPWATDTLVGEADSVKLGGGVIERSIVAVAVSAPEVPVMVTGTALVVTAALLLAVSVRTCVPANVPAANDAVTPVGRPDAASVTVPANPPPSVIVMVSVSLPLCATERACGEGESVKPEPAPLTVTVPV